jgi:hypothetical protein
MSYRADFLRRRRLGKDAILPPLHPLALGMLLSEFDANEEPVKIGNRRE